MKEKKLEESRGLLKSLMIILEILMPTHFYHSN